MIKAENLYYGFSFIPTKIEAILKEQAFLEVGEVAEWTGATILRGEFGDVLAAMVNTVNAVIEKIDDVGFNNTGAWIDPE